MRLTDFVQVDKAGVSCLDSGGTILLESHDQIYAPGGQYVPHIPCLVHLSPANRVLTRFPRGVLNDQDDGLILYYQYYPLSLKEAGGDGVAGFLYGWNKLGWEDDWPYVKVTDGF
jgi:arabinan endo-1,5-alpha-L-arabinosidase